MTNKEYKNQIIEIVKEYKRMFPEEHKAVTEQNRKTRDAQKTKFGETPKGFDSLDRKIMEMPDTLFHMLKKRLPEKGWTFIFNRNNKKGVRWLVSRYPEFKTCKKI